LIEENKKEKLNTIQGYTYYKYYMKMNFFILKNKVHLFKRKKLIDESKKISSKNKYIQNY